MESKFKAGREAYIITNARYIEKVLVIKVAGGFCTVRFTNGAGTRVRKSRLFVTEDEAKQNLNK